MLNYLVFIFFSTVAAVCRRIKLIKKLLYCTVFMCLVSDWRPIELKSKFPNPGQYHTVRSVHSVQYTTVRGLTS